MFVEVRPNATKLGPRIGRTRPKCGPIGTNDHGIGTCKQTPKSNNSELGPRQAPNTRPEEVRVDVGMAPELVHGEEGTPEVLAALRVRSEAALRMAGLDLFDAAHVVIATMPASNSSTSGTAPALHHRELLCDIDQTWPNAAKFGRLLSQLVQFGRIWPSRLKLG